MSDENSTLHPFDLAVLNAKLRRYGFAPVAGNASWFDVVPDEKLTGPSKIALDTTTV